MTRCESRKVQVLTDMPLPVSIKDLQLFLAILNCLSKFSPNDCRYMWTTVKTDISKDRLAMEQDVPKSIWWKNIIKNAYLKFYDVSSRPPFLETDASGCSLGVGYHRKGIAWAVDMIKHMPAKACPMQNGATAWVSRGSVVVSKHGLYAGSPGSIPTAVTTMTATGGDDEHVSLNHWLASPYQG